MKIIQRGQLPEEQEYRCTCYRCSTVYEFVRSEAKELFDWRDGTSLTIQCPVCRATTYVDPSRHKK